MSQPPSLHDLEQRLRLAASVSQAGNHAEAVEVYRSVAVAFRDQQREQQAIAACRALLELAPDDAAGRALLATLVAGHQGRAARATAQLVGSDLAEDSAATQEPTPLPPPLPYHLADPTTTLDDHEPTFDDGLAARIVTAAAADPDELPGQTVPIPKVELDDAFDDDQDDVVTVPRDLPRGTRPRTPPPATVDGPFFAPLPVEGRGAVLARFARRSVAAGTTVIRQGEAAHPLVIVARGRLEIRVERANGQLVQVGSIATGEYVGEAALLARTPATAHVVALTDAELLTLPPRDLYELASAFPALWAELKDTAERRQRDQELRLRER